jgi:hypothetical protein
VAQIKKNNKINFLTLAEDANIEIKSPLEMKKKVIPVVCPLDLL